MAEAFAKCYEELGNIRSGLTTAVAQGGMQLDIESMNKLGDYFIKVVDNVGSTIQASKQAFEEFERKHSEASQVVGLHGSSIQSIQAEMAIIRNNQQYGPKPQPSDKPFNALDST